MESQTITKAGVTIHGNSCVVGQLEVLDYLGVRMDSQYGVFVIPETEPLMRIVHFAEAARKTSSFKPGAGLNELKARAIRSVWAAHFAEEELASVWPSQQRQAIDLVKEACSYSSRVVYEYYRRAEKELKKMTALNNGNGRRLLFVRMPSGEITSINVVNGGHSGPKSREF